MKPLHRITLLSAVLTVALLPSLQAAGKPKAGAQAKAEASGPVGANPEEEGKIVGMPIPRSNGSWLSLRVENSVFVLSFYDAKKKPIKADAIRASARWNPPQKAGSIFSILLPSGDGSSLVGNKTVTPPHILKVYISLFGPDDKVVESFVVDHRDMP